MKRFGILAFPAGHSKSPEIHLAACKHFGIEARFDRCEIPPEELSGFIESNFRKERLIDGVAVSLPHKEAIIPFLDKIDPSAAKIGAVNTLFWKEESLYGTNTDALGFSQALRSKYDVEEKKVLVFGTGGVARAVVAALLTDGAGQVIVTGRTEKKAEDLAADFGVQWKKTDSLYPEEYHLVVNATSLGMRGEHEGASPLPASFWRTHLTAFDVVYTPQKTRFLREAAEAGARTISGVTMFLFQAMEQFRLWTGKEVPFEVMERALQLSDDAL